MFPFHRKHGNSHNSFKNSAKRRINRENEEAEMSDGEYLEYIHSNDTSRHQLTSGAHDRYCHKILREKEEVLLSGLNSIGENFPHTNSFRLGPANNDIFKSLLREAKKKNGESISMPSSPTENANFLRIESISRRKSDTMADTCDMNVVKDRNNDDEYILTLKIDSLASDMEDISFYRIDPTQYSGDCCSLNRSLGKYEPSESTNDLSQLSDDSNSSLSAKALTGNLIQFRELDAEIFVQLRKLLIGPNYESFPNQWLRQCFSFCHIPASRWRLVQIKSGSCGVIAAVEAFLIKSLLFDPGFCKFKEPLRASQKEVADAFIHTLSYILWQAGNFQKSAIIIPKFERDVACRMNHRMADSFFYAEYFDFEQLKEAVAVNMKYFTNPPHNGYINFIMSVVMSRGIYRVNDDMDDDVSLITENGHCSLKLVMLLITGQAVSNDIHTDSCLLKEVKKQADIGFLSLFEFMNTCEVGAFLKSPKFPVWLVNCTDHFTVLFSSKVEHAQEDIKQPFVLYHYDSMTAFSCENDIKLVIDPSTSYSDDQLGEDQTHLQLCIRTKWKNATVIYAENSELFLV